MFRGRGMCQRKLPNFDAIRGHMKQIATYKPRYRVIVCRYRHMGAAQEMTRTSDGKKTPKEDQAACMER
ncbi:MAG TPA: hypothetical protein VMO78_11280, partial [Rhizomicrobium sp.]|nr:hypothetical protein [Rhizomicrobium sp.]